MNPRSPIFIIGYRQDRLPTSLRYS